MGSFKATAWIGFYVWDNSWWEVQCQSSCGCCSVSGVSSPGQRGQLRVADVYSKEARDLTFKSCPWATKQCSYYLGDSGLGVKSKFK